MWIVFLIILTLFLIDLIMLNIMPIFYFNFGIPIFKGKIPIKEGKTLKDLEVYFDESEKFIYKIKGDTICYRSIFLYIESKDFFSRKAMMRKIFMGVLSTTKGSVNIYDQQAHFVLRINLSTLYVFLFTILLFINQGMNIIGYIIWASLIIVSTLFHQVRIAEIRRIMNFITESMYYESKRVKSRWGD